MENPWRGDVALVIDGKRYVMRLTLGALAALEADLKADSLVQLVERFESGAFRASDVLSLLRAGLNGAREHDMAGRLEDAEIDGGPVAAARAAADLLARAFAVPSDV